MTFYEIIADTYGVWHMYGWYLQGNIGVSLRIGRVRASGQQLGYKYVAEAEKKAGSRIFGLFLLELAALARTPP